jgi:hypothetical protein
MPAFLTHWRILIETARHSQDAGSDLGSLIVNAAALRRRAHGWSTPPLTTPAGAVWDTGPLPEIDFRFPGSDISAMAFIGALAPDILYYHRRNFPRQLISAHQHKTHPDKLGTKHPLPWSELFHTSHSGDILVMFLEQVALVPSPALRSQALAFALGYVSHIATDLALNPWIEVLAARLLPHRASAHFLVELRLDEYLATTYFEHPRYSMLYQPWGEYIEPAAQSISQSGMLAEQILQLFAMAAEVYHLSEEQIETLPHDFLAGLQGLRHFLAGRGKARWLTLLAGWRHEQQDLISKALAEPHSVEGILALENVLGYATRLSEHLCRRALNYYTALRNPNAQASERSSRRASLVNDLRNWNLLTGYDTSSEPASSALHNWVHFANLWGQEEQRQEQIAHAILPNS